MTSQTSSEPGAEKGPWLCAPRRSVNASPGRDRRGGTRHGHNGGKDPLHNSRRNCRHGDGLGPNHSRKLPEVSLRQLTKQ